MRKTTKEKVTPKRKKPKRVKEGRPPANIEEFIENTQYQGKDYNPDEWEDMPVDEEDE